MAPDLDTVATAFAAHRFSPTKAGPRSYFAVLRRRYYDTMSLVLPRRGAPSGAVGQHG